MFAFLMSLFVLGLEEAANAFGFIPLEFATGAWLQSPARALLSPLASQFLQPELLSMAFNTIILLIAGRYVEKAVGPIGLAAIFVGGAYGGAIARLLLTPMSPLVSVGATPALFAVIGGYLMLYGLPRAFPIAQGKPRLAQIAILAGIWLAFQLAFSLAVGGIELSVSIIAPLGGLAAGVALARPLLRFHYRKA